MSTVDENTGQIPRSVIPMEPLPATEILPFPPKPSGSVAGVTIQDSVYSPLLPVKHLPDDSPNILIVLIDDAGPGLPSCFGGKVWTPTLAKVYEEGIGFNRFHTTAMCSPTRGSLLTGRNHHRIRFGQITELANDWDGYSGQIPRDCATLPEILRRYGYATAAFGKWHNTPVNQTTAAGPFDNWPTGLGFEYFYGFLGGEASQYEPDLVRNTTVVLPPRSPEEGYHLSEDLADDAIAWLRRHKTLRADAPFFMYWASGAIHGPHHVSKEWADKYTEKDGIGKTRSKFEDGWDAYREEIFKRAKETGWIPQNARLTPRDETLAAWADIPDEQKPFQRRLMEVAAGYAEHLDAQVGRLLDEVDGLGYGDNTIVIYIWGDNGSAGEGQNGTICEFLTDSGIVSTTEEQIAALEELGGLDALGSPLTDNVYHAGWAWAGVTPYKGMKLLASHLGGTRNPMVMRWPNRISPDRTPRSQFTHCNDIAPTLLEILGITPPRVVNGVTQQPIDGVSFAYAIDEGDAEGRLKTQYFEIMGSRAIYHDGWLACARGPRLPWLPEPVIPISQWTPDKDVWELYNLDEDWSQADDKAAECPAKLAQLKELFLVESTKNDGLPIGGGLYVPVLHPELRPTSPYTEWEMFDDTVRIPELCAPCLGNRDNLVTIEIDLPERVRDRSGVLYKLGSGVGGLTLYLDEGTLHYEYNLFLIERTKIPLFDSESRRPQPLVLPAGQMTIEVRTTRQTSARDSGLDIVLTVNTQTGETFVERGKVPRLAPLAFTANDCLDIGRALGSPVSLDYRDRAPFPVPAGTIKRVHIAYTDVSTTK